MRLDDRDEPLSIHGSLWRELLDVVEDRADLGMNYPTWEDLRQAAERSATTMLGKVALATAREHIIPQMSDQLGVTDLAVSRRGRRAWLSMFGDELLSIEIHVDPAPSVSAVAYLPSPPRTRRSEWEDAVKHCETSNWQIERSHLKVVITLDQHQPPHIAAAQALKRPLEPLFQPPLWPKFAGRFGAAIARSRDLAELV